MNKQDDEEAEKQQLNLDLLPYPAQTIIVRHLRGSSTDIINLGLAFPTLVAVADLTKTTWMFDKIFPILARYMTKYEPLKCRLVCHTWMQVVDKYLENIGFSEPDYGEPERYLSSVSRLEHWSRDAFGVRSCWLESSHNIADFMEKMMNHTKNPFTSRCVQINDRNDPRYWQEVMEFLERFGADIWKLRLGCYCSYPRAVLIIRNILALLPNLKILSLEFNGIDPDALTEEETISIQQDLDETSFPPLPHLFFLDWSMCTAFYNAALPQYSQQLVDIRLMDSDFMESYDSRVHGTFPSLKTLVVRVNHEDELFKLLGLTSPLRRITTLCDEWIPLHLYIRVFHHFASTLENFNVEYGEEDEPLPLFEKENPQEPFPHEPLEFPLLKCIRFENPDPLESFDALLCIKPGPSSLQIQTFINGWLEEFRVYQLPFFVSMAGEQVEIHGYLEKMNKSKIWEMMPQLQTVEVKAYDPGNRLLNTTYRRSESKERVQAIEYQAEE